MKNYIYIPFNEENEALLSQRTKFRDKFIKNGWHYDGTVILTDPFKTKSSFWILYKNPDEE
jgi:hypothetical protein